MDSKWHLRIMLTYVSAVSTLLLYLIAGPISPAKDPEVCYQWHMYGVVLNVRTTNTDDVERQYQKLGRPDTAIICPWDSVEK